MDAAKDQKRMIRIWKMTAFGLGFVLLFTLCFTIGNMVRLDRMTDTIEQLNQRVESTEATYVSIVRACEREKKGETADDEIAGETMSGGSEPSRDLKPFPSEESGGERQVILLKYTKSRDAALKWKEDYEGTFEYCSPTDAASLKLCVRPVRNGEIFAALLTADGLGTATAAMVVSCLLDGSFKSVNPKPEMKPATLYSSTECL